MAAEPSEGKGEYKRYCKKDPRLHYLSQAGKGVESGVTLSLIMNFKEQLRLFFFVIRIRVRSTLNNRVKIKI